MTSSTSWTPAPRAGLVPLYPYGFGTILGRSFAALRGNPKVLLGFAMVVQVIGSIATLLLVGLVAFLTFSRLDTVPPRTREFDEILAGSTFATGAAALVAALCLGAIGVIVQGVVVGEVAHATVGERASLRLIWARVRPVFWRLVGYFLLTLLATTVVLAILVAPIVVAVASGGQTWVPTLSLLLTIPGAIVLGLWLATKLYVVPSAIVLEHATLRGGIVRSWTLTRGRFWSTFGVLVLINMIMSVAAFVISTPLSWATQLFVGIVMPFGSGDAGDAGEWIVAALLALLTQVLTLLVQAIGVVVQATSAVLVYIDARMRREGLDVRLQRYVERRELGESPADPWSYDPSDVAPPRPEQTYAPAYGAPPYGPPAYGPPAYGPAPGAAHSAPGAPSYGSPGPQGHPPFVPPAAPPGYGAPPQPAAPGQPPYAPPPLPYAPPHAEPARHAPPSPPSPGQPAAWQPTGQHPTGQQRPDGGDAPPDAGGS
ncbi:hypothetical protein [Microbacterium album]|uniref:DUF7847 domain-containing protein n=1 Tax=Microbacterium album TaxID=2053191 RepID=A0A917ML00_9MICO|nr:hypothetical protein [Microbacterium album]GGH37680.1 hypothetical protein GCM10010921_07770 [Microbacterium album]